MGLVMATGAVLAQVAAAPPAKQDFWERQFSALLNAPVACLTFLGIGAMAAWWFSRHTKEREITGLKGKNEILEERLKFVEQIVKEREASIEKLKEELEDYQEKAKLYQPFLGGEFATGNSRAFAAAIKTLTMMSDLHSQLEGIFSAPHTAPENALPTRGAKPDSTVAGARASGSASTFPLVANVKSIVIHPKGRVTRYVDY